MALDDYTPASVREMEADLRESIDKLKELRDIIEESKEKTVQLNLGSLKWHVSEIKRYATQSPGIAQGKLKSRAARKAIKSAKKS